MTTSDEVDPKDATPTLVSAFSVMAATAMNFSEDAVVSIDFRFKIGLFVGEETSHRRQYLCSCVRVIHVFE